MSKTVVIIGAGPAGLTAAYELLKNDGIMPIIIEATSDIGGIAKTVNYKGNRMDMGGHRFFSKSDKVMKWWLDFFPLQSEPSLDDKILGISKPLSNKKDSADPEKIDKVMLLRSRISRIYYLKRFFDYPVALNSNTIKNLGLIRMAIIGFSYFYAMLFQIKPEKSLEDFMINRFGNELYNTFFKNYTTKVWGVTPSLIKPEWGAQRIKKLSVKQVLLHALRSKKDSSVSQKSTQTSLIEQFIYPKYGPGQIWEEVAAEIIKKGGKILFESKVTKLSNESDNIKSLFYIDKNGNTNELQPDYVISTMPVKDLISSIDGVVPTDVKEVADGLIYRDFMTVGLLLKELKISNQTNTKTINNVVPDNWIYIQEDEVSLGRLQIFNNWSPYMLKDTNTVWIGLEYFVNEGDNLWTMKDDQFGKFAINELEKIGIIDANKVLDFTVVRIPKAYPAYFGTYDDFDKIKDYTNKIKNLYLVGRNGMHRYNNMDHSMLTAMSAVDSIVSNNITKESIWSINAEEEYHESKKNT